MQPDVLPSLPIPKLDETAAALLDVARPLLTDAEFAETRKAVEEFTSRHGAGATLHQALSRWKASLGGNRSWLRPFWDDSYLAFREPLPINMNYTFRMEPAVWGGKNAPAVFIRALTHMLLRLWRGEIAPEPGRQPLDMEQTRFLTVTRIPVAGRDVLVHCQPVADPYIVVLCRGQSFMLHLADAEGNVASATAIARGLDAVRAAAADRERTVNPFIYSSMPREEAAVVRAELMQDGKNRVHMSLVEQALFVVCLDEENGGPEARLFEHDLLTGPPENRFFDKSIQVVARPDGVMGVNIEHAGCDASAWLYLFRLAADMLDQPESPDALPELPPPAALDWHIPAASARKLTAAREDFLARRAALDTACLLMPEYSRNMVKAFKCSPDAFIQMGFQAAQYQCLERFSSSYEAVAVRTFAEGRTECARGSSQEAKELAQAICRQRPAQEIRTLFRAAEARHMARLEQCQKATGVERCMLGLENMYLLHGQSLGIAVPPAIFTDPGWMFVKRNVLSTSGTGSGVAASFGFGPVDPEGFGLAYNYGAALSVTITAYPHSACTAETFAAALKTHLGTLAAALAE